MTNFGGAVGCLRLKVVQGRRMSNIFSSFGAGKTVSSWVFPDPIRNGARTETDAILLRFAMVASPMIMKQLKSKTIKYITKNPDDFSEFLHPASFRFLQVYGRELFSPTVLKELVELMVRVIEAGVSEQDGNDRLAKSWAMLRTMLGPPLPVKE